MKTKNYNLFLFLLFFCPNITAQFSKKNFGEIDKTLQKLYQNNEFNGVVLMASQGKIVYKKELGIANIKTKDALKTNSSFNLASVSKQFVAMMIMQLKEQGKLAYDDKVQSILKTFPYKNISIRHLLNHTSGLPEYFDFASEYVGEDEILTNQKLLALFAKHQPDLEFQPGSKHEYNNTGYALLANIIEQSSNMPIEDFFDKNIVKPLGMKDAFVLYHKMKRNYANGHQRVFGFEVANGKKTLNDLGNFDGVVGDGNLYASAEDLLKWDQALYTNKLVKFETIKEAFTPGRLNNGKSFDYGFGWEIEAKGNMVSHTGSWVGFENYIERNLLNKSTLIILSSGSNDKAIEKIIEILYE